MLAVLALISVNNQTCPVSGQPAVEEHNYVHNGKKYNLCSDECSVAFAESPDEYAEIAENEEVND